MNNQFRDAYNWNSQSYILKQKFESGNTVELELAPLDYSVDGPLFVEVTLSTFSKRKHKNNPDFYYSIKGRDGLEPAIWATRILQQFPEFLFSESWLSHKNRIIFNIFWSDSRRRDIYHKWLSRYGFYFGVAYEQKCLMKTFDR